MLISELFRSPYCGERIERNGYVTLPLLMPDDLLALEAIFSTYQSKADVNKGFYTSIWSDNEAYRRNNDEQVKRVLMPRVREHLRDVQPVFANFMVKSSGEGSSLLPHQDWSFVEEPAYDSVTIWCPLADVDSKNGNLRVIPGSHRINNYVRARFAEAPFRQIDSQKLEALLVDVPLKAGEAIILNSRLIHASPDNLSGITRIAASVVVAPGEARLYHWVQENATSSRLKKIPVTQEFYWKYSCYDTLESVSPERFESYDFPNMKFDELLSLLDNGRSAAQSKRIRGSRRNVFSVLRDFLTR